MTDTATTPEHNVNPGLFDLLVPISEIEKHPRNPRVGNVDAIAESLKHNTQAKPIVTRLHPDGKLVIVAGNHTFMAAQKLGWTHIAAVQVEMDDEQEERYLLADNRVSDLGDYDLKVLQGLLEKMQGTEAGLAGTGFVDDDIAQINDVLGTVEGAAATGEGHVEDEDKTKSRYKSSREEGGTPSNPMMDVTLTYPATEFDEVKENVEALKKAWGIDATRDVVKEALARCAKAEG